MGQQYSLLALVSAVCWVGGLVERWRRVVGSMYDEPDSGPRTGWRCSRSGTINDLGLHHRAAHGHPSPRLNCSYRTSPSALTLSGSDYESSLIIGLVVVGNTPMSKWASPRRVGVFVILCRSDPLRPHYGLHNRLPRAGKNEDAAET